MAGLFVKSATLYLFQSELLMCSDCLGAKQMPYRSLFLTKLSPKFVLSSARNMKFPCMSVSVLAHAAPHLHADRIKNWFLQRYPRMNCGKGEARSSFRDPLSMGIKHRVTQMMQLVAVVPHTLPPQTSPCSQDTPCPLPKKNLRS